MKAALLLLVLAATPQQDPVRLRAELASTAIAVGETTSLEISVETRGPAPGSIDLPPLPPALEIVGTRDYTQIQFTMPGGRVRVVRREILIRARAAGEFRIPPITVSVGGDRYQTRGLVLRVSGAASATGPGSGSGTAPGAGVGPGSGAHAGSSAGSGLGPGAGFGSTSPGSRGPGDEVILRAALSPETAYVGQQITLRSEVLVSEEAQFRLRRAPDYSPPDAPGFWVQDLPGPQAAVSRMVGGLPYVTQSFARAYFPLSPGRFALAPARLRYDIRRGFLYATDPQELASDSLRLVVLPLPEAGRPRSFAGAVGRFRLESRLEPAEVPAGEASALIVEVEGAGNVKSLPPPILPTMDGVQVYPPSEATEITPRDGVVAGVKRFTWVLVPERAGTFEVPEIEYAFFDPEIGSYDVARSRPGALLVRPAPGASPEPAERPRELRPLRLEPQGAPPLGWVRSPWFAGLQLVPLLGLLALVAARRRGAGPRPASRRALRRRRRAALAALRPRASGDDPAFFGDLATLLRGWVAERLGLPVPLKAAGATLSGLLQDRGASAEVAAALADLLDRVESARFQPTAPGAAVRVALLERAERLLEALDRQARRPARPEPAATAGLALLLSALCASGAGAQQPDFQSAVEHYRQGDYATARRAFQAYVDAHPADAAGWYNLGSACYRLGERGCATRAWLRTLRLAPRDEAARDNLALAGADAAATRGLLPALPLSPEESLLSASLAWILGALAIAASLARGRRGWGIAGAGAVLLSLALLGARAVPRWRPAPGIVLPAELPLRAEPTLRGEPLAVLEGGRAIRVMERRAAWLRVRGPGNVEGWVEAVGVGTF